MAAAPDDPRSDIDWVQVFLSGSGRMGRATFVIGMAAVLAVLAAYDRWVHGLARSLFGWLVVLLLVFTASCLLSKRLHDRGRSGWWTALILWAFTVVWPRPQGLVDVVVAVPLALAALYLTLAPGEPRANRFGPP